MGLLQQLEWTEALTTKGQRTVVSPRWPQLCFKGTVPRRVSWPCELDVDNMGSLEGAEVGHAF